jgi:hypothetical protein
LPFNFCVQLLSVESNTEFAVHVIAAALGNDVDNAARGAAEFSFKTAGFHLDLLYELGRNGVVAVQRTGTEVGDLLAVDDEDVLRTRSSVNRETAGETLAACSGSSSEDAREIDAFRQKLDLRGRNVGLYLGRRRVNRCNKLVTGHIDLGLCASQRELDVDGRCGFENNLLVRNGLSSKTAYRGNRKVVRSRRKLPECIKALRIRGRRSRETDGDTRYRYGRIRDDSSPNCDCAKTPALRTSTQNNIDVSDVSFLVIFSP